MEKAKSQTTNCENGSPRYKMNIQSFEKDTIDGTSIIKVSEKLIISCSK